MSAIIIISILITLFIVFNWCYFFLSPASPSAGVSSFGASFTSFASSFGSSDLLADSSAFPSSAAVYIIMYIIGYYRITTSI